jgi:ubiquinone/menaquinone biosynthesis C-methylase UbiE
VNGTPDAPAYFGSRSALYDSRYDRVDADGHALRARLAAVLAAVGDGPGAALDVGMGPGRLCEALARRGWTVSGADASEGMVAAARARLPEAAERLVRAEVERLPWPDGAFDVVTATGVLEYSDLGRALPELARVLRPGGLAVVSYPNPASLYGIWKSRAWYAAVRAGKRLVGRGTTWLPRGAGVVAPTRFGSLLAGAGLEPASVDLVGYLVLPSPVDALLPRTAARLGARFEGRGGRAARRLATQAVYAARRR